MSLDRREFLRRSLVLTGGATLLPSSLWPFRKIFVPANPVLYRGTHYRMDMGLDWDFEDGVWRISGEAVDGMYRQIVREYASKLRR